MQQKRYWLRGALIIGGIYATLFISYALFVYFSAGEYFYFALIPLVLSGIPATLLLEGLAYILPDSLAKFIDHSIVAVLSLLFVFAVTQWFLLGSFVGWVYGKIKNKRLSI